MLVYGPILHLTSHLEMSPHTSLIFTLCDASTFLLRNLLVFKFENVVRTYRLLHLAVNQIVLTLQDALATVVEKLSKKVLKRWYLNEREALNEST